MLDPSIPLSVRPPQLMNLQDVFNAQRQHQQFETQQQLAQSELKSQGLQQQQQQTELSENQAVKDAINRAYASGNDLETALPDIMRASPTRGTAIQKNLLDNKKTIQDLANSALKHDQESSQFIAQQMSGVKDQAGYDASIAALHAAHIDTSKMDPVYDPAKVQGWVQRGTTISEQIRARTAGAAEKRADTGAAEFDLKKPLIQAQTTEAQQKAALEQRQADATALSAAAKKGPDALAEALAQLPYGRAKLFEGETDPAKILQLGLTPAEQTTAANAAAGRTETNRHNLKEEQQGAQRVATEQANTRTRQAEVDPYGQLGINPRPIKSATDANGQDLHGEEFLKTVPGPQRDKIRGMAEGRLTAPTAQARSPIAQADRAALLQYDPEFSEQRAQIRKAFTTGPEGKNIGALNTATAHLDQLHEVAMAMQNGNFQPGNALYNYIATKFGSDKVTNYNYVMNALAGETASALKGNATDPEIANVSKTLANVQSPAQALGAATEGLKVMGAKLNTYDERYHRENAADKVWSPVLPTAKAVFDKYGLQPTAGPAANVKPPAGNPGGNPGGHKVGDVVTIGGKQLTIGKIYPDGTFDPK